MAPLDILWAGVSPGGAMINNLLLVAWANGDEVVSSARHAEYVDLFVLLCRKSCSETNCTALMHNRREHCEPLRAVVMY